MTTIGDRIRIRREELGLSQDELAKRLGYKSRSSLNKIELNQRNLKQDKIKAIAEALETTPSYIMGWDEEREREEKQPPIELDDFTYAMYQQSGELTEEQKRAILHMVEVMKQSRGF